MSDKDSLEDYSGDFLDVIAYVLTGATVFYTVGLIPFLIPVSYATEGIDGVYPLLVIYPITLVVGMVWVIRRRIRITKDLKLKEQEQKIKEEGYIKRINEYRKFKIRLFRFL